MLVLRKAGEGLGSRQGQLACQLTCSRAGRVCGSSGSTTAGAGALSGGGGIYLAGAAVDLDQDLRELAGNVGGVAVQHGRVAVADLAGVVHHDNLRPRGGQSAAGQARLSCTACMLHGARLHTTAWRQAPVLRCESVQTAALHGQPGSLSSASAGLIHASVTRGHGTGECSGRWGGAPGQ